MSATARQIEKWEAAEFEVCDAMLFSRGVNAQEERRCPYCDSIIYSRRHKLCGVCASPLPATCLFSSEQAQSVAMLVKDECLRHRQWLQRANSIN